MERKRHRKTGPRGPQPAERRAVLQPVAGQPVVEGGHVDRGGVRRPGVRYGGRRDRVVGQGAARVAGPRPVPGAGVDPYGPGAVLRCSSCESLLMVVVDTGTRYRLSTQGFFWMELEAPEGSEEPVETEEAAQSQEPAMSEKPANSEEQTRAEEPAKAEGPAKTEEHG